MLMPSVFGRDIFDDFMDGFTFPDVDKELYGKHAKNVMKTDVRESEDGYEVIVDLPGFKKDEIEVQLENGYLNISAAKGLDKDETDKKGNSSGMMQLTPGEADDPERKAPGLFVLQVFVNCVIIKQSLHTKYVF